MPEQPTPVDASQVTQVLKALAAGDEQASERLFSLVYEDLRKLAAARMARLAPGQTLQATALVHEAYMRLVGSKGPDWEGRAHFFGAAARAMRNVLADHLQRKGYLKNGGHMRRVAQSAADGQAVGEPSLQELAVEEALEAFEREYPRQAEVVTLTFFGGLNVEEVAEVLKLSTRTVERDWRFSKAWMNRHLANLDGFD